MGSLRFCRMQPLESESATRMRRLSEFRAHSTVTSLTVMILIAITPLLSAWQGTKKPSPTNSPEQGCIYGSRFFRLHTYQSHGISCQQCTTGGKWLDVGGQNCEASKPQRQVGQHAKPKAHVCSKEGLEYSAGAVYYDGADDCARCTERPAPNDWDALDKAYFCENVNPEGDASAAKRDPEFSGSDQQRRPDSR